MRGVFAKTSRQGKTSPQGWRSVPRALLAWTLLTGSASIALVTAPAAWSAPDEKPAEGQPQVVLDRLDFPPDVVGAEGFEKHLKRSLARQARRVDWGAGRENRIEYRFAVTELRFLVDEQLLTVHCKATGRLPGGQTAKSEISFSGQLSERSALVKQVLDIVARGVMTRLSEMERRRRGLD